MRAELRISTLKRMLNLIEHKASRMGESGSINVADYTSATHLAAELNCLFRDYPILVAHASQLQQAGSFITVDIGPTPLLVNRDREGEISR